MSLPQLLGDDFRRRIWIQKSVAQDLADDLVRAAIVGFRSGLPGLQGGQTALLEGIKNLVITLAAITIFLSDDADLSFQTLSFDEHEEAAGQIVGGGDGQGPSRAGEFMSFGIELKGTIHRMDVRKESLVCLINYGGIRPRFMDRIHVKHRY